MECLQCGEKLVAADQMHECPLAIIHEDIEQNTPEWESLRLTYLTASAFRKFIQPAKLGLSTSKTSDDYCLDITMQCLGAIPPPPPSAKQLEWGHTWQPGVFEWYQKHREATAFEVGFVSLRGFEGPGIGCSPDGLVGADGGVEIKCHWTPREHARVRLDGITHEHRLQVLASLWITGREWWDYISYLPSDRMADPDYAIKVIRVERDEVKISKIRDSALAFRDEVVDTIGKLEGTK